MLIEAQKKKHERGVDLGYVGEIKNVNPDIEKIILSLDRQFLHAKILGFFHPSTGKEIEFSSKLPKNLEIILKKLRKACK